MSVQTQLERITEAKISISSAIKAKGVPVPDETKIDGMAALILTISAGGGTMEQILASTSITIDNTYEGKMIVCKPPDPVYSEQHNTSTSTVSQSSAFYAGSSYSFDTSTGQYTVAQTTQIARSSTGASNAKGKYYISLSTSSATLSGDTMYYISNASYASSRLSLTVQTWTRGKTFDPVTLTISTSSDFSDYAQILFFNSDTKNESDVSLVFDGSVHTVIPVSKAYQKTGDNYTFTIEPGKYGSIRVLTAIDNGNHAWSVETGYLAEEETPYASLNSYGKVEESQASSRIISVTSSKTLSASDAGTMQYCKNTSSATITIPKYVFDVGTEIEIVRYGTGAVTISANSGVYLNGTSAGTVTMGDQYSVVAMKCLEANKWLISGGMA